MPPSTLLVNDEFVPALPTLKQILSTSVTTLLHVPKILRAQWKTIFSGLLEDFLQTQTHEAFQKLLLAPKCLLSTLPRAGVNKQLESVLSSRFRAWQAGEFQRLWSDVLRRTQKRPEKKSWAPSSDSSVETPQSVVHQAEAAVAEGAFSKGLTLLNNASRLAPADSETASRLQKLHPQ